MKKIQINSHNKEVIRNVTALALPITIQNIFSTAVSSADVIMVGRLGQDSLSAVSLAGQVTFVLSLILLGLTIGTSLISAQYYGKGDTRTIGRIQGYAIRTAFLITAVFCLGSVLFPAQIMRAFTAEEKLIAEGTVYLRIIGFSYLLTGFTQVTESVMKAVKQVKQSTLISTTALVLNVFFNALFIFGWFGFPRLGIAGAALGTLLARSIEAVWCFLQTRSGEGITIRGQDLLHTGHGLRSDFWKYTLPITLNGLSWGTAFALYSVILGHIGSDMVAANAIASIVRNFALVGCNGVASAAGIYLGALLGGNDFRSAKNDAVVILGLTFAYSVIGGLLILLLRPLIMRYADVSETAGVFLGQMLIINAFYIIAKAYNCVFNNGILSAGGDTRFGLICDTVDMWCYSVPLGFIAAFLWHLPPMAVYLLISTDEVVKLPFYYWRYKKGYWIKNITKEEAVL